MQTFDDPQWNERLQEHNRDGFRIALTIAAVLYPVFGLADYLSAPRDTLWWLWGSRLIVTVWTLAMFPLLNRPIFRRHQNALTTAHSFVMALGICVMVTVKEGLASNYYAGLSLILIGSSLLYLWPPRAVLLIYGGILLTYLVPNVLLGRIGEPGLAAANSLFLISTAVIAAAGQIFNYRTVFEQHTTQLKLAEVTTQIEAAHRDLQKREAFKSQFFANITHELKTPLAMILSPIELMEQGDMGAINDVQGKTLRSMLKSGTKLLKLINDLLDMSKLEESALRLNVRQHDLLPWLRALTDEIEPLVVRKHVTLTFHTTLTAAPIWVDIERFERVVVNLLSNATKFTPSGGTIDVTLLASDAGIRLTVADSGCGFAPENAAALFERFFQVDMGGTRKYGGTGIGLALAHELVMLHGGQIWATGEEGKGATFFVELQRGNAHFPADQLFDDGVPNPAADDEQTVLGATVAMPRSDAYRLLDIAEVTERRVVERDLDEHTRPFTVLVVDDTPDIIRIIHMALRRHFKVMAAPDGLKGLELAERERPDLIVTDLMMPGIDGLELTRRIRADPAISHIPIVMLTARGAIEDRVAGIDTGVNAYLQKPFSPRELLSTVHNLLDVQTEQANRLLSGRMDSLETITGGLAHEINNPLNYIKNGLEVIEADVHKVQAAYAKLAAGQALGPSEERGLARVAGRLERMFDSARAGVVRIGGAVELMRRYSREGYSRAEMPTDLWTSVRDVAALLTRTVHGDVAVHLSFEGQAQVDAVVEELHQVLSNLVQNAIEAAEQHAKEQRTEAGDARVGHVWVHGEIDDGWAVLSVRDNGGGVSETDLNRVFTAFYTTKGPGHGMGMGLTITWRVVQAMGGRIDVTSPPGEGACFTVRLPLSEAIAT